MVDRSRGLCVREGGLRGLERERKRRTGCGCGEVVRGGVGVVGGSPVERADILFRSEVSVLADKLYSRRREP
jgi:hypothetical protein